MSQWPDTSESLVQRVCDPHDTMAWSQFLDIYYPVVYQLSRRKGLQHADAMDLCQGVFVSVSVAVQKWEPQENGPRFRNWLSRIARNAILNALTRKRPDRASGSSSVVELLNATADGGNLEAAIQKEGRLEAFRWAARQIEPEFHETTWKMFRETAVLGRSIVEVAAELGCSTGAIYIARCRVLARIRDRVNELSDFWSSES